jgi:hypothetical protein
LGMSCTFPSILIIEDGLRKLKNYILHILILVMNTFSNTQTNYSLFNIKMLAVNGTIYVYILLVDIIYEMLNVYTKKYLRFPYLYRLHYICKFLHALNRHSEKHICVLDE